MSSYCKHTSSKPVNNKACSCINNMASGYIHAERNVCIQLYARCRTTLQDCNIYIVWCSSVYPGCMDYTGFRQYTGARYLLTNTYVKFSGGGVKGHWHLGHILFILARYNFVIHTHHRVYYAFAGERASPVLKYPDIKEWQINAVDIIVYTFCLIMRERCEAVICVYIMFCVLVYGVGFAWYYCILVSAV